MERWGRFTGIVGLVMFGFGFIGSLLVGGFDQPLLVGHLILGLALIGWWFFRYGLSRLGEAGEVFVGRTARFGANAIFYIAVFAGFLIVANWLAARYDKRWDLTESNVYSLSSQSVAVVEALKKPLKLVAFKGNQLANDEQVEELFKRYRYHNPGQVSAELIDPRTKVHLVDKYQMKPGNIVYLQYGEDGKGGVSRINEASEEAITNAIIKLTRGEAKKIYYVEGHGEPDLKDSGQAGLSQFAAAIADEHLTIEGMFLAQQSKIPDDAATVILAAPRKPLLPAERDLLVQYARGGGRLMLLTDPRGTADVKQIAAQFSIDVGDNVVIDQVQRLFAAPTLGAQPVVRTYGQHPISKNFSARDITIFTLASSVTPAQSPDIDKRAYVELVKTSESSWAETDLARLFDQQDASAELDATDLRGPVSLALAYEHKLETSAKEKSENKNSAEEGSTEFDRMQRVVVYGDSDWINNTNIGIYANRDLAMNTVNWLVGEEGGISIRPKSIRESAAPISRETFVVLLSTSFIVPELILIFGLFVWWRRRTLA